MELKSGETFNGHLINCDSYMNLTLNHVFQTSPLGDQFFQLPECYLRGNTIKYIRVNEDLLQSIKTQQDKDREQFKSNQSNQSNQHNQNNKFRNNNFRSRGGGRGGNRGRNNQNRNQQRDRN